MKKRGIRFLFVAVIAVMLTCVTGCNKVKQIRPTSVKIEAISPAGLKSVNVFVALGIKNPSIQIGMTDIHGSVRYSGKIIGIMNVDPFKIKAKSEEVYHLRANLALAEGTSLLDLLVFTDPEKLNECTVDISVRPEIRGGLGKTVTINDIPLKKLIDKTTDGKIF